VRDIKLAFHQLVLFFLVIFCLVSYRSSYFVSHRKWRRYRTVLNVLWCVCVCVCVRVCVC